MITQIKIDYTDIGVITLIGVIIYSRLPKTGSLNLKSI